MSTESGYSNQKKLGISQFKTIQSSGSGSFGTRAQMGTVYEKLAATPVESVTPVLGDNGQVKFLNIEITSHTAIPGDIMQMTDGTLQDWKFEIVQIIDADNFYVLDIAPSYPIAAEEAEILGHQLLRTNGAGEISVSASVDTTGLATDAYQIFEPVTFGVIDFSSDPVSDAAYVELIADSLGGARKIEIFMSNGNPLLLAYGGVGSEVNQIIVIPGGNGLIDCVVPASTRVSVIAAIGGTTSSTGVLAINLLGEL